MSFLSFLNAVGEYGSLDEAAVDLVDDMEDGNLIFSFGLSSSFVNLLMHMFNKISRDFRSKFVALISLLRFSVGYDSKSGLVGNPKFEFNT